MVIDDYAHHPTEIEAALKSVELYDNLTNFNNRIKFFGNHINIVELVIILKVLKSVLEDVIS